jgi:hypothetical protein
MHCACNLNAASLTGVDCDRLPSKNQMEGRLVHLSVRDICSCKNSGYVEWAAKMRQWCEEEAVT